MPQIPSPNSPKSPTANLLNPPWNPPRRSLSSGIRSPAFTQRTVSLRDDLINKAEKITGRVFATIEKLTLLQRILAGVALVIAVTLGILFLVFNEKIFGALEPFAESWKNTTGGWTILWGLTFLTAFPPMIGYSTCGTTAGFVYGVGEGWLILATATITGSFCSFLVSRTVLRKYVERLVANDRRFAALTLTMKQDGLKLLCMIRLCPLPYSLSNGAMSTFPTVDPSMYALATALITPKLLIHVFIGSRLAVIARSGEKMSAGTRAVNWASIIVGGIIGTSVGIYIYRKTMARAAELEAEEVASVRDSVRRTGMPPRIFSDDPEAQFAAETIAEGDDEEEEEEEEDDHMAFFDDDAPALGKKGYQDETDDESDVFGQGDGTDDEAIGLRRQSK